MMTSQVALVVKNQPAVQETRVRSLGQEDPLQKGMAAHSSILAWRIPWIEEPGRLQSIGPRRVETTEDNKPYSGEMTKSWTKLQHCFIDTNTVET